MGYYLSKIIVSAVVITLISELARRHSLAGAMLASIPVLSLVAVFWLFIDTGSSMKAANFLTNVFWLTLPSLLFFISAPLFLKSGLNFYLSMFFALILTVSGYLTMIKLLTHFKITGL